MNKVVIELFTSPTCPHCHTARNMLNELSKVREDILVYEHSIVTQDGSERARIMEVMSVPSLFLKGPNSEEIVGFKGTPVTAKINEEIDKALGKVDKENVVEKKSFFSKMKNMFVFD